MKITRKSWLQGKANRDQSLEHLRQHIHKFYVPLGRQFMVLFPEDGNFNQSFANKIIDYKIGDSVEWILDVTIAYSEKIPLHLLDVVPTDSEGMTNWLYDRFIEKDKMLEEFYRTGKFPAGSTTCVTRRVRQDNLRYLILHMFFIASSIFQYQMFSSLVSYFW
ncbi:unnamed protein product [Chilo suppressalis]|uniref:Acyltransferase C-terminal domain-containing protein n=1 Tax=Chilo suppressalis TaxID=168631 RepID=A0ABN8AVK3_CHISP|nr:unnamed protein product [Chilo suppressalis]